MIRTRWLPAFILFGAASAIADQVDCVTGTLASYEALATGCMVGPLLVEDFVFSSAASLGTIPVSDTAITVTPTVGPGGNIGLNFASAGFSIGGTESEQYLIGYTWDPTGDIRSLDDIMDPPVATFPGIVQDTTIGCIGAGFIGAVCPTATTVTVHVFDNGTTLQLSDSASFAPTGILGVRNMIDLEAMGNPASFDSIGSSAVVPEPATWLPCAALLGVLAARRRFQRRRLSQSEVRRVGFEHLP